MTRAQLHQLPISARPAKTTRQKLNAALFIAVFLPACIIVNAFQFMFLLPLKLLPFAWSNELYNEGIRYTKGAFAILMNLMNQVFAPTRLSITFERDGQGKLTEEEVQRIVERDGSGKVTSLRLPTKSVIIANHQVYSDWWYVWGLTYFMGTHKDVFIVLKNTLKWVPIGGWGMQFYRFIFLARSWASDRLELSTKLSKLARQAEEEDKPFTFILYPEGTLVSKDTRPLSRKYADKLGISDLSNVLLPRSTGLHYSLRSLAPRIPGLKMIDITMMYPGIPPMGYGQSYYTLRSIFCDSVPPPVIHMHIRIFDVAHHVPIGDMSTANPNFIPNGGSSHEAVEVDFPEDEKVKFDLWLRNLWTDKDNFITNFLKSNSVPQNAVSVPLELRSLWEIPHAFCMFAPIFGIVLWKGLTGTATVI
ncbi:acyltransferase-domain-containing protein [Hygrophoropsis aurantiaca]|uniref:Acyltransferase-domain-containing protein n=1 Tax=Hygrophoropsis aurantiaca TaxID=72124 RepID=A0ACB8APW2_9AGAM|nr:acyltransferase-domain-containing protein [Hygrophoropsis aurantiaca]